MANESCVNCLHEQVCSLPASATLVISCPYFLDRDKYKEIIHARWLIPDKHYPDTCSNCLFEFVWDSDEGYHPNYCPQCGALMVRRKELYL